MSNDPQPSVGAIFTGSEHYAAGRMDQLGQDQHDGPAGEILHDAIMAAFQAGALFARDDMSVRALLVRMES